MRKIAIVGKCTSTRSDAPILHDSSWETWGLAWDLLPHCHRYFELHAFWRYFRGDINDAWEHWRFLAGLEVPVYMREAERDIPRSVAYPFKEIAAVIGTANGWSGTDNPYCESSIGFMLAQAIYEAIVLKNVSRIGIWGVDMGTTTEYAYQRPNMEYLIGFARGRGIPIFIPPQSSLLSPAHGKPYGIWEADPNWKPPPGNWPILNSEAA